MCGASLTSGQGHFVSLYASEQFPFAGGDFSVGHRRRCSLLEAFRN
jgi:hypothetical protein